MKIAKNEALTARPSVPLPMTAAEEQ